MIDLNNIPIFARVAQFESFSRAARALGIPGHAMLGFKIDQQRGTAPTVAALVPSAKFNGTIIPARNQEAKLDLPTPVSVGFIVHRIRVSICHSWESLRGSASSRKQPNMLG